MKVVNFLIRKIEIIKIESPQCATVWKFQDFSITQILREINFGESSDSKTAVFIIFGALNFDF